MSEHEGFCVPLVEAMHFNVPIIAYDSTAIPSTLGGSGFLIDDKNPVFVAGCIDKMVKDQQLQNSIVNKQNERIKDFAYERISKSFEAYLNAFIEKKN
jgi:glycosyltransferase involved in cell wall biosynthesis